jgi:hypothetical protein
MGISEARLPGVYSRVTRFPKEGSKVRTSQLFRDIRYVGQAEGVRKTYHVFETSDHYLVVAPNTRGGYNLSVVSLKAPEVISRKFKGQHVTTQIVKKRAKRPDLFGPDFAALSSLYVTVALGRAGKLKRKLGKSLLFKIS